MTYIVTLKKLEELEAPQEVVEYFQSAYNPELKSLCYDLIEDDRSDWVYLLLDYLMSKKQRVQFAFFAAKQALDVFNNKYPYPKSRWPRNGFTYKEISYAVLAADFAARYYANVAPGAAAEAAFHAANAAGYATNSQKEMQLKLIDYACELIEGET